jgi:hypothetical protein
MGAPQPGEINNVPSIGQQNSLVAVFRQLSSQVLRALFERVFSFAFLRFLPSQR